MIVNGSQKWLIGILTTVVLGLGAGWMGYIHSQIEAVALEQLKGGGLP